MIQKYIRYRILQEFFDFPRREFRIREMSRIVKLSLPSAINHISELQKDGLITKKETNLYPVFTANRESEDFKTLKRNDMLWRIHESGLINLIESKIEPNCIVLFGSSSRGEDTEESDIDIFVQSKEFDFDLESYEKKLNRKINILFEPKLQNLSKELLNNIANGIVLSGYLKVLL